jgi:hypothetical protein
MGLPFSHDEEDLRANNKPLYDGVGYHCRDLLRSTSAQANTDAETSRFLDDQYSLYPLVFRVRVNGNTYA